MSRVEVLSSRVLLRPRDFARSRRFYAETLGLAIYREFGSGDHQGVVFFLGAGFLEVSGRSEHSMETAPPLWLQVRDVAREHERLLAAGVPVTRAPVQEPWGLIEMWITDPDGLRLVLVETPEDHPLRRDQRGTRRGLD
jgi:predicted enzyme related to lactoylglutathione lyase